MSTFDKKDYDPSNPDGTSYKNVARDLVSFRDIQGLPAGLHHRMQMYQSVDDSTAPLIQNRAVYHKSCLSKYDKTELSRAQKEMYLF